MARFKVLIGSPSTPGKTDTENEAAKKAEKEAYVGSLGSLDRFVHGGFTRRAEFSRKSNHSAIGNSTVGSHADAEQGAFRYQNGVGSRYRPASIFSRISISTAIRARLLLRFLVVHLKHIHSQPRQMIRQAGFTIVETIMGIAVVGLGVAATVGALTKFNSIAATSRNMTGAYTVVMNQIDLFQSMSPFNPQKTNLDGTAQIPKDTANNPPLYDMTAGTHTLGYQDPVTKAVSNQWPVYQYKDPVTGAVVVVRGTLQIQVTNMSTGTTPNTYRAVVTITYPYRGSSYSFSMSTIRTSDI